MTVFTCLSSRSGIVYEFGADTTFSYECVPVFADCGDTVRYQGYDYATVLIGEQCWFAENLRSENYENGDAIPAGLSDSEWVHHFWGCCCLRRRCRLRRFLSLTLTPATPPNP